MKIDIFRLISVDPRGIGNTGNGLLDFLYSYLLWQNGLGYYKYIRVNQIHQDQGIEEFVDMEEGKVHINIIFNTDINFDALDDIEKNRIRLDIIHSGLLRLSDKDPNFSNKTLRKIRDEILQKEFNIEVECLIKESPYDNNLFCKILVNPLARCFDYYILLQKDDNVLCKIHFFRSNPLTYYFEVIFNKISWKTEGEVIIEGSENQMKMSLDVNNCKLDFQNLTIYPSPPLWEMANAEISEQEKRSAYQNWLDSLPPAFSAIIGQSEN